jgi:Dyp-type peroxidase family
MAMPLRLENIQGNITPGFRKDHQVFVFLRFPDTQRARCWLETLRPDIASAAEVATFNRLFGLVKKRRRRKERRFIRATWVNVAFSFAGLKKLRGADIRELNGFPEEFRSSALDRADRLGDRHKGTTFDNWEVGSGQTEADAFLLIGADTVEDRTAELCRQVESYKDCKLEELATFEGDSLTDAKEHFGFRDAVSQPDTADPLDGWETTDDVVEPGEFILGYRDERGRSDFAGPSWASDGSYVVFRKLRQHVPQFRDAQRAAVETPAGRRLRLDQVAVGARLMGRWPSGAKLGDPSELSDPQLPEEGAGRLERSRLEYADFQKDPDGQRIPRFAHVRKAYPRDLTDDPNKAWLNPNEVRRHRLIRRGIPYGKYLPEVQRDRLDRGLLFLAYQASIGRQFEFIYREWLRKRDAPRAGDQLDPIVGRSASGGRVTLVLKGENEQEESVSVRLARFVSVAGSGYFFAPSIRALRYLADPAEGWFEVAPPSRHVVSMRVR